MGGREVIKEQQGTWGEDKQVWQSLCDGVGGMHVTSQCISASISDEAYRTCCSCGFPMRDEGALQSPWGKR